ncbi:MAG: hypothetical protein GY888_29645, partial [Planctomycetaceae bacterium]|nr:hypothetical protein [Planctomycetaceae bacterium]
NNTPTLASQFVVTVRDAGGVEMGTTAALDSTADAATLQTALAAIVGGTTVTGTGTSTDQWVVTFGDTLDYAPLEILMRLTTQKGATLTVAPTGEFVYDPTTSAVLKAMIQNQWTEDMFTYEVKDPHGEVSTGIATMVVSGVNNAPEAVDDTYQADQDEVLTTPQGNLAGVLANDTDPDLGDHISLSRLQGQAFAGGSATVTGTSAQGATVTLNLNGTLTYDPTASVTLSNLI